MKNIVSNDQSIQLLKKAGKLSKNNLFLYLKEIQGATNRSVRVDGKELIMLASYSYLGLIDHAQIVQAAHEAIEKFGTGAGGVRLISGTTTLHKKLEERISAFKKTEDAILYSSGYLTNVSVISTLLNKGDLILIDKYDHQSIYDGCLLSKADWKKFNHNDLEDLRRIITENREKYNKILIVVDAVYSMDGDIAPMPEIIDIADEFEAFTMVDEAHALGVIGKHGRGIDEYYNLKPGAIDIYMGTFSKAIPSIGGYIAGRKEMIDILKYSSNAFVFSAAIPPSCIAASIKSLEIIEKDLQRHNNLKRNIDHFINGVKKMRFNTLKSKDSAIIPIIIGDELKTTIFAKRMFDSGIFVCPIIYPAVPKNSSRLRCCIMATHTDSDINYVLDKMKSIGKELRL